MFGQDEVLRARLVAQSRGILKAQRITKFGFSFTQMSWSIRRRKKTAGNQPLPESGRVKIPFAFPLVFPQLNVAMHRAQKGFSVPFIGLIAAINRSELESNRGN